MPAVELTPRETEVLACITQGRSNREIAEDLHIAEKTVRIHVSSVLDKMGARDRTQATIYALQRGIVHLEQAKPTEDKRDRSAAVVEFREARRLTRLGRVDISRMASLGLLAH